MLTEKPYLNVPEQTPDTIFLYRANQFVETDDSALDDCRGFFLGWEGRGDRLLTRLRPGRFTRPGYTPPAGNPNQSPPIDIRMSNLNPWDDTVMAGLPTFFEPPSAGVSASDSHVSSAPDDRSIAQVTLDPQYEPRRASYSIIGAGFGFPLVVGKLHTIHADICVWAWETNTCLKKPEGTDIPTYTVPPPVDGWLTLSSTWWGKLTLEEQGALTGDATGVEILHPKGLLVSLNESDALNYLRQHVTWTLMQPANRPDLFQTEEPTIAPKPFSRVVPHARLNIADPGVYEVELAVKGDEGKLLVVDRIRVHVVAATKVAIYLPHPANERFNDSCCNDQADAWDEGCCLLPWGHVILQEDPVRVKVTLSEEIPAFDAFQNQVEMRVFSEETDANWQTVDLDQYAVLENENSVSTIRITLPWSEAQKLLTDPVDTGENREFTSVDLVTDSKSNFKDSDAFESGMTPSGSLRGNVRKDTDREPPMDGDETKLIAPLNADFLQAAGVQFLQFRAPGMQGKVFSPSRQIQNQADMFYYSGHGHRDGKIADKLWSPDLARQYWNDDLETLIFAGCSVLTIHDYARKWLYRAFYEPDLARRDPSATDVIPRMLGDEWRQPKPELSGPRLFLGYQYWAPRDTQGSDHIIADWARSQQDAEAWMDVNQKGRPLASPGRNACAVDFRTSPWTYHFFWDEKLNKEGRVGERPKKICDQNGKCTIAYDQQEQRWPPLITYSNDRFIVVAKAEGNMVATSKPIIITLPSPGIRGSEQMGRISAPIRQKFR